MTAGLLSGNAQGFIDGVIRTVREAADGITHKRRPVALESYRPIDAKTAVFAYPQPLGIAICLSLELSCWLLLCMLLALPHDAEPRTKPATQRTPSHAPQAVT
jgi:hypothetical protein